MDKQHRFDKMARVTATYCDLIEHLDVSDCAACLRTMAMLLPELHAAVAALPAVSAPPLLPDNPDIDARFELFSRLRQALGDLDSYWLEYDRSQEELDRSGSLADDFTDIYFDLKFVLDLYKADPVQPESAMASWQASYRVHWGQHLVDAERQLYALLARTDRIPAQPSLRVGVTTSQE